MPAFVPAQSSLSSSPSPSPSSSSTPLPSSSSDQEVPAVPAKRIRRPPNAFILFRIDWLKTQKAANKEENVAQCVYSRRAGESWAAASPEVKEHYAHLAAQAALAHKQAYPGYKYRPGPQKYKNGVRIVPPAPRKPRAPRKPKAHSEQPGSMNDKEGCVNDVDMDAQTGEADEISLDPVSALYNAANPLGAVAELPSALEGSLHHQSYSPDYYGVDVDHDGEISVSEMEDLYLQFDV